MGKMQRDKGQRGEREFFGLLSEHLGTCVRRNVDQARQGGADGIEVPGWAIEVKRHESGFQSIWWEQAIEQCSGTNRLPALAYRASRQKWRVRVPLGPTINRVIAPVPFDGFSFWDIWAEVDLGTFALIVREGMSSDAQ